MAKILIVDDDRASCRTLQLHLEGGGHEVGIAHNVADGLELAQNILPDLLILDIRMPGESGLEGLPRFKLLGDLRVIMITAFHDMESTIEAMQNGADDYIHKPLDIDELDAAIAKCLGASVVGEGLAIGTQVVSETYERVTMVGRSRAMKEVFKTIGMVAKSPATVLITGESGTGKELVARAIHRSSGRPGSPFVAVNCAAVVDTLLESDLFGHEKGAFTGAISRQPGKFELADNGTIFLDEVGEMSPVMQAKLLRVLQYKEFVPLGSNTTLHTRARIIAATNVDLTERVAKGVFREDLFYRLQVVLIQLPPLRERREDIGDLVRTLLGRINRELGRNVTHIGQDVMDCLQAYDWPGNVRELENVLMKAVALSPSDAITLDKFPEPIRRVRARVPILSPCCAELPLEQLSLAEIEKRHVARVLSATAWHRGRSCEILGVSRPRLRRMIQDYELQPPQDIHVDDEDL